MRDQKPFATFDKREYGRIKTACREFKTYRELRKNLPSLLKESENNEVHVTRYKRGEWGQWFEIWKFRINKPVCIEQGWM